MDSLRYMHSIFACLASTDTDTDITGTETDTATELNYWYCSRVLCKP